MPAARPGMGDNDQPREDDQALPFRGATVLRWLVDVSLALHFAAGAFWWWFSPKGFPVGSSQFWTDSVLPITAVLVAAAGLVAMHRRNWRGGATAVICFSAAWAAAAIAGRVVFPLSLAGVWLAFTLVAIVGAVLFAGLISGEPRAIGRWPLASVVGAIVGVLIVVGQIPPAPTTSPWEGAIGSQAGKGGGVLSDSPALVPVTEHCRFLPAGAQLEFEVNDVWFECRPFLEFHSVSPDRFWSLLSRTRPAELRFDGMAGKGSATILFRYHGGASIEFAEPAAGEIVSATAITPVLTDTYSHLNSYCYLRANAHDSPTLTFSPCGSEQFAVLPADYPFGRPARFAYRDADGTFRVCEATSGEKGPFRTLASGRLKRDQPLTIGFHNNQKFVASITLDDWSVQASTSLSPSAGWGVPVNAIEFQLVDNDSDESVGIWITLAATSVGRGFDTVGHRAGTYRNRLTIRSAGPGEAQSR